MTSFIRDSSGLIIPLGRTVRTLRHDFMENATLPWWLETGGAGTASLGAFSSSSDTGHFQLASAATDAAYAVLRGTFDIRSDLYDELIWSIYSLRFDNDAVGDQPIHADLGIYRAAGATNGVGIYHASNQTKAYIRRWRSGSTPATQDTAFDYWLLGGSGLSRMVRNVTFRWRPKLGHVAVMDGDQIVADLDVSADQLHGPVRPHLVLQNTEAVAHNFKVAAVEFSLVHN